MKMAIEAYGIKGLKSKPWRRTFRSGEELSAWVEDHDAEVHGSPALIVFEGRTDGEFDDDVMRRARERTEDR